MQRRYLYTGKSAHSLSGRESVHVEAVLI
jgi:hypothetical protein